jgi:hypothetical protein
MNHILYQLSHTEWNRRMPQTAGGRRAALNVVSMRCENNIKINNTEMLIDHKNVNQTELALSDL